MPGGATLGAALLAVAVSSAAAAGDVFKGVCYRPGRETRGDWTRDAGVPLWGDADRGDLRIIRSLGANAVRVYGVSLAADHANFFDGAYRMGLNVAVGLNVSTGGDCPDGGPDCFQQIKDAYALALRSSGLLTAGRAYHPAVRYVDLLFEPRPSGFAGLSDGASLVLGVLVAFDAVLDAEEEAGITGQLVNFTASFPDVPCPSCAELAREPALQLLAQLDLAVLEPSRFGCAPRHDLAAAYRQRFVNSFALGPTTAAPGKDFVSSYAARFPSTPFFVAEYPASPSSFGEVEPLAEVAQLVELAAGNDLFLGMFYSEFSSPGSSGQSAFEFGDRVLSSVNLSESVQDVPCLKVRRDSRYGMSIPQMVASAYGGRGVETSSLCGVNPWSAPLTQGGFAEIAELESAPHMKVFIRRVIAHFGAAVTPDGEPVFEHFVSKFAEKTASFFGMVGELRYPLPWLSVDANAACVADRNAQPDVVRAAVAWMCQNANSFSCHDVPAECSNNPYRLGDYVFSRYYGELRGYINPLVSCYSDGAAVYATSENFMRNSWSRQCVQGADKLPEQVTAPEVDKDIDDMLALEAAPSKSGPPLAENSRPDHADIDDSAQAPTPRGSRAADIGSLDEDVPLSSAAPHGAALKAFMGAFLFGRLRLDVV